MDAKVDYIRLATWDYTVYLDTKSRLMLNWAGGWEPSKWLQYRGWRKEGVFIGNGDQNGKRHMIVHASGHISDRVWRSFAGIDGWYCTRLDVQITIDIPLNYTKLCAIRDETEHNNMTLIEGAINDTLYLGSRTSELFTRLYEKPILDGMFLRLEYELKGSRARQAWLALSDDTSVGEVFKYYLEKCKLPDHVKAWFEDEKTDATDKAMRLQLVSDDKKILEWIQSIDGAMLKHMASTEIGSYVRRTIRGWAKYADELDKNDMGR
jgi:hypothetical protein